MDKNKKTIVITSIFEPTEAVKKFSKLNDYNLIVVGDKKSPIEWECDNVRYLSVAEQNILGYELIKMLPYNHYCRKMIGYLEAIKLGSEFIIDTDDDNMPKDGWSFPDFDGDFETFVAENGFVNIYELYTDQKIWPRGLPLRLINSGFDLNSKIKITENKIGVWQGLADEDPDVDAIYRLTNDTPCYFKDRGDIVLADGVISPFNSQNTMIRKELFPLLYLPTTVTFRFTDILRGLIAQPIMNLYNYNLGFTNATVIQKRNPHDYMKDFYSEIPMYENCEKVIEITKSYISKDLSIEDNLYCVYVKLFDAGIVLEDELVTLRAWLNDLKQM